MKNLVWIFAILFAGSLFAQGDFKFDPPGRKKAVIPFKHINNLIFIPITVNGIELTFLLDSGVEETILFSLDDKEEISFNHVEKALFRGLGSDAPIEGLKSSNNVMEFPGLKDLRHDIYIVLDQNFNFSSSIGIPVNGIIGYHFFKNHLVEINYDRKKIIVHEENKKLLKKLQSKFAEIPLTVEKSKPYVVTEIESVDSLGKAKLLVDLGNSDALWLFQNVEAGIKLPAKNFNDFLGRGFSGEIHGKRARIDRFKFAGFDFTGPISAFPDSNSITNIIMVKDRIGSVGAEILKRFTVILDYPGGKMYLKKGRDFDIPFHYNMSGIEVHHDGMTWVKETVEMKGVNSSEYNVNGDKVPTRFTYKFELKPVYAISNVRTGSPAEECGLKKGDLILSINSRPGYKYSLQEINTLMKSEEGKMIDIVIERDGKPMDFRFQLKSIL